LNATSVSGDLKSADGILTFVIVFSHAEFW